MSQQLLTIQKYITIDELYSFIHKHKHIIIFTFNAIKYYNNM